MEMENQRRVPNNTIYRERIQASRLYKVRKALRKEGKLVNGAVIVQDLVRDEISYSGLGHRPVGE